MVGSTLFAFPQENTRGVPYMYRKSFTEVNHKLKRIESMLL